VKTQIGLAEEERTQHDVHRGLLQTAYQRHYDDLLGAARLLRSEVHSPDGARAAHKEDNVAQLLRQALRAHTSRSALWKALDAWRSATDQLHATEGAALSVFLTRLGQEIAQRGIGRTVIGDALGWRASIHWALEQAAQKQPMTGMEYHQVRVEEALADLAWGNFGLVAPVDEPTRQALQEIHAQLVTEVQQAPVVETMQEARRRIQGAQQQIDEEVAVLILRRMVPGRCKLCPS